MREIKDFRKRQKYDIAAIITACICMFLLKEGSRNAYNNDRNTGKFKKNYKRIFKMPMPHPDTVDAVMRILAVKELEFLKKEMVNILNRKKVFTKYRIFGRFSVIAVDATGVFTFTYKHCPNCCHTTSKNGKITYFHNVLEAKLICANGFAISIATEWIENPSGDYDKQDCETKAFVRLSENLKKQYPRLPICIAADGLYPNKTIFDICKKNEWEFILTFKDGNLPSVWDEVNILRKMSPDNEYAAPHIMQGVTKISDKYSWVNNIPYWKHSLNWIECLETKEKVRTGEKVDRRFVHITSFPIKKSTAVQISRTGRLRWKIENEGFNSQKNHGFNLQHKYSRVSPTAMKNYYQCLQIAHIIIQLLVLEVRFKAEFKGKYTIIHLWKTIIAFMLCCTIDTQELKDICRRRAQYRYA